MKNHTLTGNDVALCCNGVAHAINWWKKQPGRSGFKRKNLAALQALNTKLQRIEMDAYPYRQSENLPDFGGENIMILNRPVVRKTRAAARKANREAGA